MPERYRREMLADWWGAGRAQMGMTHEGWFTVRNWYKRNAGKMHLHPETRQWVEFTLDVLSRHPKWGLL